MQVATIWLLVVIPKGFIPSEDTGRAVINTEAAEGTSFEAMDQAARERGIAGRFIEGAEARALKEQPGDEIVVTGTAIRGVAPVGSATVALDLDELLDRLHAPRTSSRNDVPRPHRSCSP